jgi:hypothetical protein
MLMRLASEGRFDEIPEQAFPIYVHPNRHSDGGLKRAVGEMAESTGPDAYLRQQQAILSRPDSRLTLGSISCPTIVLVGETMSQPRPHSGAKSPPESEARG